MVRTGIFGGTHALRRPAPASFALAAHLCTPMGFRNAGPITSGTTQPRPTVSATTTEISSAAATAERRYVSFTTAEAAPPRPTPSATSAPVAAAPDTTPRAALLCRRRELLTPLNADGFNAEIRKAKLSAQYPSLVSGLRNGFMVGFPNISYTHTPPNNASIYDEPAVFLNLIATELSLACWIGPFTRAKVERNLGAFQTLPCSLVEKPLDPTRPNAPRKMRLIQNFLAPRVPQGSIHSINHDINIADFPCTWGTPEATKLLVWTLPPGSEMAVRDVASAYQNITLHLLQWPAAIVHIAEDAFAMDTCGAFSAKSVGGVWGLVADASCDIF
jgi:hypothetical protein